MLEIRTISDAVYELTNRGKWGMMYSSPSTHNAKWGSDSAHLYARRAEGHHQI